MLLHRRIWIQAKAGQVKLAVGDVLGGLPTRSQPTRIKLVFREALWKHSLKRNKLSNFFRCPLKKIRQVWQHLLQIWGVSKHGQGWKRSNARHWRGRPAGSKRVNEWKTHQLGGFFFLQKRQFKPRIFRNANNYVFIPVQWLSSIFWRGHVETTTAVEIFSFNNYLIAQSGIKLRM